MADPDEACVLEWRLPDEQATLAAGARMAAAVRGHLAEASFAVGSSATGPLMVYLHGDLGAGKTCLSRGLVQSLGHDGPVKSPTYTLVEPYENLHPPVYHFDLYRLSEPTEVEFLGVEDCFSPGRLCLVEWPGNGRGALPGPDLEVTLTDDAPGRRLRCVATTGNGVALLDRMRQETDCE